MAFQEDLTPFFSDFTVTAQVDDRSASVILSEPDQEVLNGRVVSTHYTMTFRTVDFPDLDYGDQVVIGTVNYNVQVVNKEGDGAVSMAILQRV
jgi:hypothetical protein